MAVDDDGVVGSEVEVEDLARGVVGGFELASWKLWYFGVCAPLDGSDDDGDVDTRPCEVR